MRPNIDRLNHLANVLDSTNVINKMAFDMTTVGWEPIGCNTAGCIAGATCELWGTPGNYPDDSTARNILGLSKIDADRLFFPLGQDLFESLDVYVNVTHHDAASAIRKLISEIVVENSSLVVTNPPEDSFI